MKKIKVTHKTIFGHTVSNTSSIQNVLKHKTESNMIDTFDN